MIAVNGGRVEHLSIVLRGNDRIRDWAIAWSL